MRGWGIWWGGSGRLPSTCQPGPSGDKHPLLPDQATRGALRVRDRREEPVPEILQVGEDTRQGPVSLPTAGRWRTLWACSPVTASHVGRWRVAQVTWDTFSSGERARGPGNGQAQPQTLCPPPQVPALLLTIKRRKKPRAGGGNGKTTNPKAKTVYKTAPSAELSAWESSQRRGSPLDTSWR